MLIAVVNLKGGGGRSTCAVNLACELADLDHLCNDRWQGKYRVVLVDADADGAASKYSSGGHLPVSSENLPIADWSDMEGWIQRVLAIQVDFVIVDAPLKVDIITKAIVGICDLVVVPWCAADDVDLIAVAPIVELIRVVRSASADGGPKCLLVPTHVNARTTAGKEIETVLGKLGEPIGPAIHQMDAFVDAAIAGRWIGDFAYNSAAHQDIKALASAVRQLGKNMNGRTTDRDHSIEAKMTASDATAAPEAMEYSAIAGSPPETD
ncbi:MAG: ParA family protein [Bryobacteraceae bacterium]